MSGSCSKKPELPNGSAGRSFIVKIWGEGWKVHDFLWLIRGGNRKISRAPEVTVFHLGEGLASYKRTRRYHYVHPLRRNQYSPLAVLLFLDCSIFVPAFPVFPKATVGICTLELRMVKEAEWSPFPTNNPMDCSMPGLPVHHQLLEFTQIHVHRVYDAIQPSHPLSSPSPPAPNPSQHQSLFQWVNSSHEVAKVLEFQL